MSMVVATAASIFVSAEFGFTADPARIDFKSQVAPILRKRCLRCHGPNQSKGGLRLDSVSAVSNKSDTGRVVVPGRSEISELVRRLRSNDQDERMPRQGKPLTTGEISLIAGWIDQGGRWPLQFTIVPAATIRSNLQADHWSFQPIRRPATPVLTDQSRIRNGIDAFVLQRLHEERATPSPEANRATLIRRVTLDLLGLPPTPEEVDAFVNQIRPDTYEQVVDRLLASPHYGERWARPWLDLCHYADTDGYLTDQLRPVAWRYRAWLVRALNDNQPFDQFTIEQIAGDRLPRASLQQRIATGFLRQTLSNREGGADPEEFSRQTGDRSRGNAGYDLAGSHHRLCPLSTTTNTIRSRSKSSSNSTPA